MGKRITLDNLGTAVEEILKEYSKEVDDGVAKSTEAIAKTGAAAVRSGARSKFNTKRYAKGWSHKFYHRRLHAEAYIYNKDEYQLSHLLENGHQLIRDGKAIGRGFVQGRPHIKPVEDEIAAKYEKRIKANI